MLLGTSGSYITIIAMIAFPGLIVWLVALVWSPVVHWRGVRWCGICSLGLAFAASVLCLRWERNCHNLTLIVADGFTGTISLIKDSKTGVALDATGYNVVFPAGAWPEVRIRDDRFMFSCYTATVRSVSGLERTFREGGVSPGAGARGEWSTKFDGTRHEWVVQ